MPYEILPRSVQRLIDEFAIYSTALDATTITAHYDAGLAAAPSSAVPEPSTLALAALGLLPLGTVGWRRRRRT